MFCFSVTVVSVLIFQIHGDKTKWHTWYDNEVRELATVCLPWQHWTKALVWFDDVDISAFHSCVVVDL